MKKKKSFQIYRILREKEIDWKKKAAETHQPGIISESTPRIMATSRLSRWLSINSSFILIDKLSSIPRRSLRGRYGEVANEINRGINRNLGILVYPEPTSPWARSWSRCSGVICRCGMSWTICWAMCFAAAASSTTVTSFPSLSPRAECHNLSTAS